MKRQLKRLAFIFICATCYGVGLVLVTAWGVDGNVSSYAKTRPIAATCNAANTFESRPSYGLAPSCYSI